MKPFGQFSCFYLPFLAKKLNNRISSPVRVHFPSPPCFGSVKIVTAKCQIDLYIKAKILETKNARRIQDAAGARGLLRITYLLTFCPAAGAGTFRVGRAGTSPRDSPAASHRVPGVQWLAQPYEPGFVKKFLSFSCQFPSLNILKTAHHCAPNPKLASMSMTATASSETAIQFPSGIQKCSNRQPIKTTPARRSRALGRMAAISLAVKWSEALFAGASTKMNRTAVNKATPTVNSE